MGKEYSEKEKQEIIEQARREGENYYCMIEGIERKGEIPSQDRDKLYALLEEHNGIKEVLEIQGDVSNYDYHRARVSKEISSLERAKQSLFNVLGKPKFD